MNARETKMGSRKEASLGATLKSLGLSLLNATLILIGILGFVAGFAISLGPVMWVLFSELFPNRLRGLAISLAGLVNSAVSFGVQLVFPWELENLGNSTTFLIYGVFAALGLVFVLMVLPETKGRSLEELETILDAIEGGTADIDVLSEKVERAASLIKICREKLSGTELRVQKVVAELVGGRPLLRILQDLVSLAELLEACFRVRLAAHVRVVLASQLAVGPLDLVLRGVALDAHHLVVVFVLHVHLPPVVTDVAANEQYVGSVPLHSTAGCRRLRCRARPGARPSNTFRAALFLRRSTIIQYFQLFTCFPALQGRYLNAFRSAGFHRCHDRMTRLSRGASTGGSGSVTAGRVPDAGELDDRSRALVGLPGAGPGDSGCSQSDHVDSRRSRCAGNVDACTGIPVDGGS